MAEFIMQSACTQGSRVHFHKSHDSVQMLTFC